METNKDSAVFRFAKVLRQSDLKREITLKREFMGAVAEGLSDEEAAQFVLDQLTSEELKVLHAS